ncbi:hypothetical protein [Effusibacillus consociatus]|uniref:Extracellular protein n=1 Tax=Effusibacillus consociatus TaxID=1117041 RepID=A0ABV9PZ63_9BACL
MVKVKLSRLRKLLLVGCGLALVAGLFPAAAGAYSYGDPNEEQVAEVYKKMVAKLNESPADFAGAKAIFEPVKNELDMHMGPEPAASVLANLNEKKKDEVIHDMQKILVLNIARRLENIEKDFKNYSQTKLLIAKANATYAALSPSVKEKNAALDASVRQEFENALQSLGNPGLFGVGVKEPDPASFKSSKEKILKSLQDQFGLKSLEVGHFKEGSGPGNEQNAKKQVGTDFSDVKNWIPIALIVIVVAGVIILTRRKMRK